MGVLASRSIEGDFNVFDCRKCENNFERKILETVLGMLGLRYPILSILSAFKFVKLFSSLRMQLIAVGVSCIADV